MHNSQQILTWAEHTLTKHGYTIIDPLEMVREVPWSKVWRFRTSQGWVYLKQMAKPFAIEPILMQFLRKNLAADVPHVIEMDFSLSCFLMNEAGTTLRDNLKKDYQTSLVCHILKSYAKLQSQSIEHVNALLTLGVPDWRLAKLPTLYRQLIDQTDVLIADGLTKTEVTTLQHLFSAFCELCVQLAEYKIPETLEHGDFHDNNILVRQQDILFNDWGDATISHPFFSLASWLNSALRHHSLQKADPRTLILQNAYLEMWQDYASFDTLREIFSLVKKIRHIQFTLNFSRVKMCEGMEKFEQFNGYMAQALRDFIALFKENK